MPSEKSARSSKRKAERNKPLGTVAKTHIANAQKAIAARDMPAVTEAATRAQVALDKAAQKGVIHPNNAARRKSRLMKKLNVAKVQP